MMRKCGDGCEPCCDFCKRVIHAYAEDGSRCEPLACSLHQDYEHQMCAQGCGSCEDFECFNCPNTQADRIRAMDDETLAYQGVRETSVSVIDYDWDEEPYQRYETVWETSDCHQFDDLKEAIDYELEWLQSPLVEEVEEDDE